MNFDSLTPEQHLRLFRPVEIKKAVSQALLAHEPGFEAGNLDVNEVLFFLYTPKDKAELWIEYQTLLRDVKELEG